MAFVEDWGNRFNAVQDIWTDGCSVDPAIFVTAYFYNLPRLVWTLFKPDPIDTYVDLKKPRGHKPKRNGRMRVGGVINPEGGGGRGKQTAVFKLGALAERIGWYFIIVDAALDLAVNWSSTAYQWSGCVGGACSTLWSKAENSPLVPGDASVITWGIDQSDCGYGGVVGPTFPRDLPFTLGVSMRVKEYSPIGPPVGTVTAHLVDMGNGATLSNIGSSGDAGSENGFSGMFRSTGRFGSGEHITLGVFCTCNGGFADIAGSQMRFALTYGSGLLPDPL